MQDLERARLDSLTSLRFGAALLVVIGHSIGNLAPVPRIGIVTEHGAVGVEFFFVLSGFVLAWSHRAGDTFARFYRRRLARVYPLHFATLLLAIPVLLILGENIQGSHASIAGAETGLLLIQAWFPQPSIHYGMNGPSWSLSNEAFFYAIFPFLIPILHRAKETTLRVVVQLTPAVVLIGAVAQAFFWPDAGELLYTNPAWRILSFIAGAALAVQVQRGVRVRVHLGASLGLTVGAYLALPIVELILARFGLEKVVTLAVFDAMMLPLFLLLVASAAGFDLGRQVGWIQSPVLVRLGEWSFALYLTHWLLIDVILGIVPGLPTSPPLLAITTESAFIAAAVAVSAAVYVGFERPLERRLRGERPRSEDALRADRDRRGVT